MVTSNLRSFSLYVTDIYRQSLGNVKEIGAYHLEATFRGLSWQHGIHLPVLS